MGGTMEAVSGYFDRTALYSLLGRGHPSTRERMYLLPCRQREPLYEKFLQRCDKDEHVSAAKITIGQRSPNNHLP